MGWEGLGWEGVGCEEHSGARLKDMLRLAKKKKNTGADLLHKIKTIISFLSE